MINDDNKYYDKEQDRSYVVDMRDFKTSPYADVSNDNGELTSIRTNEPRLNYEYAPTIYINASGIIPDNRLPWSNDKYHPHSITKQPVHNQRSDHTRLVNDGGNVKNVGRELYDETKFSDRYYFGGQLYNIGESKPLKRQQAIQIIMS